MSGNSVFFLDSNFSELCYNAGYSVTCTYLYSFLLQTCSLVEFYSYSAISQSAQSISATDAALSTVLINSSTVNLFSSILADSQLASSVTFFSTDLFLKLLTASSSLDTVLYLNHFEVIFINELVNTYFLNDHFLNLSTSFKLLSFFEYSFFMFRSFFMLLFIVFFMLFFIVFYLSLFTSNNKEENSNDFNTLLTSLLFEAEKEIGSIDDIILALFIVFYLFFWYFYTNFLLTLFMLPDLILLFYTLPLLYFMIIFMPTVLLLDFGLYFIMYLKGSSSSSLIICEAAFDYIAVCVFYTRLVVQGVRLVLMIATYMGLNEVILYFTYSIDFMLPYDTQLDKQFFFCQNVNEMTYYFILVLPTKILYWLYELFHTFFVVTVQFGAFFAMVFWLFLFLYTFFVSEKTEAYFKIKRSSSN